MGILIRKMQQGGGLFANPATMDLGARDMTGLIKLATSPSSSGRGTYGNGYRRNTKSTAPKPPKLDGMLPSDIDYYNAVNSDINSKLAAGIKADNGFESTAAYDSLIQRKHELETIEVPKMKNMQTTYTKIRNGFGNKDGAIPAIYNDRVLVHDGNKYEFIDYKKLMDDTASYNVISVNDLLDLRQNNFQFSGFTSLGRDSMKILNKAYGQEELSKFIKTQITGSGYRKGNVGYLDANDNSIDLTNITFDDDGLVVIKQGKPGKTTKSNANQIGSILDNILTLNDSKVSNYLTASAVRTMLSQESLKKGKFKDADNILANIFDYKRSGLAKHLKSALIVENKGGTVAGGGIDDMTLAARNTNIKLNKPYIATITMFKNPESVEVGYNIDKDSKEGALLYFMPSSKVHDGEVLIENGYKGATKRILDNNTFIQSMKDNKSPITTVDGLNIYDLVESEDANWLATVPRTSLFFIIAPIELDNKGAQKVNFKSKYAIQIATAVERTYAELNAKGITAEELAKGDNKEVMKEAVATAQAELEEILKKEGVADSGVRLGVAATYEVMYFSKVDYGDITKYPYTNKMTEAEEDMLDDNEINYLRSVSRKTRVFQPLGQSFWDIMKSSKVFGPEGEADMSFQSYTSLFDKKSTPDVGPLNLSGLLSSTAFANYNEQQRKNARSKKQQHGGKLASADNIHDLLFN